MKNLFIDSNVWLSLYHFTNDDLAQFGKLKKILGQDIKLYIPKQVYDEVLRNREAKLKDAFKSFEIKSILYPAFCKEYDEYAKFNADYTDLIKRHKLWYNKIKADMQNHSLPADTTIQDFFNLSGLTECDEYVERAYTRYRIGNPPGKDNKYGDAINWECLLATVPDGEDLYFVSVDKDYRSEFFDDALNPFLANEWKQKKHSEIHFYTNLVKFLNEHFEDIKLKTEQVKQDLIDQLAMSPNFLSTHGIIAMMNKHVGWTEAQIESICSAAENNTQVSWLLGDDDVFEFYKSLLSKVNYDDLPDGATKRVIDSIIDVSAEKQAEAYEDAKAEAYEAYEEFYRH